jgi:hypothetical protein
MATASRFVPTPSRLYQIKIEEQEILRILEDEHQIEYISIQTAYNWWMHHLGFCWAVQIVRNIFTTIDRHT